jgi:hypothetical protein
MVFSGSWTEVRGNYSGGTIHKTTTPGDSLSCTYHATQSHTLYVGLRYTGTGGTVSIVVDGNAAVSVNLAIPAEDTLFRHLLGTFAVGAHTVIATHTGVTGTEVYFDFLELASPSADLPVVPSQSVVTLATDWDTLHCISLPPERTAWMLKSLNFVGRANRLCWRIVVLRASAGRARVLVGCGDVQRDTGASAYVTVTLGQVGQPPSSDTVLQKQIHVGDTPNTIALAFAQELNRGYILGVWVSVAGSVLTITARTMGLAGDANTLAATTTSGGFTATASGSSFTGGADGNWRTDVTASPALNRAVRDWSTAYFAALVGYGIDAVAAFSMELQHGDPSAAAGIAQVGPAGDPILLPTPSLQTNFSPASLAFWKVVYQEMAAIQAAAGLVPYLQFGEVQWWYFPNDGLGTNFSGMPFYDAWNLGTFAALYSHPLATITQNTVDPAAYPDEAYCPPSSATSQRRP